MAESSPNATILAAAAAAACSSSSDAAAGTASEKPICAICYADLHALSELLQSIPVCGHVFHELCLQHWIDYCPAGKEPTCPVCKQGCTQHPPTRLYFQSTGSSDSTDTEEPAVNPNSSTANLPQGAVIRMELRISALDAHVQEVDYKVNRLFRESAEREVTLLCELSRQERLQMEKMTELAKKKAECSNLKQKNLCLSKKLSTLNSETRKLKSRCNGLTRSEARTERKLDEALKLNEKLKGRIEELQREREGTTTKALGKRKAETSSKSYAALKNKMPSKRLKANAVSTSEAFGMLKAETFSSKLYASSKNEKSSEKLKAKAVSSDTKNVIITRSMVKKALLLNEPARCTDADEKVSAADEEVSAADEEVSEQSNGDLKAARTRKRVRRIRGLRSLLQPLKAEVEVALPKMESRARDRRSKVGKN